MSISSYDRTAQVIISRLIQLTLLGDIVWQREVQIYHGKYGKLRFRITYPDQLLIENKDQKATLFSKYWISKIFDEVRSSIRDRLAYKGLQKAEGDLEELSELNNILNTT